MWVGCQRKGKELGCCEGTSNLPGRVREPSALNRTFIWGYYQPKMKGVS